MDELLLQLKVALVNRKAASDKLESLSPAYLAASQTYSDLTAQINELQRKILNQLENQ